MASAQATVWPMDDCEEKQLIVMSVELSVLAFVQCQRADPFSFHTVSQEFNGLDTDLSHRSCMFDVSLRII